LASDSEGRSLQTELDMFLTAPAINNECPNLGRPTCSQAIPSACHVSTCRCTHQIVNQAFAATATAAFTDWNLNLYVWLVERELWTTSPFFHVYKDVIDGILMFMK